MAAVGDERRTIDDVVPTDWLTVREAADVLGVSVWVIYRRLRAREIESSAVGRISGREVLRVAGRAFAMPRPQTVKQRSATYARAAAECRRLAKTVPNQGRTGR